MLKVHRSVVLNTFALLYSHQDHIILITLFNLVKLKLYTHLAITPLSPHTQILATTIILTIFMIFDF